MAYRSILLNLHSLEVVEPLINAAVTIGHETRSHLVGFHSIQTPMGLTAMPYSLPANMLMEIDKANITYANEVRDRFELLGETIDSSTEWHLQEDLAESSDRNFFEHVLTSDLVLVSQSIHERLPSLQRDLLQKSTTPLLVLPTHASKPINLNQIMIAWNGSVQTSRAIRDSMYLLERANEVRIVCTGDESKLQSDQIAGTDVATWLGHHGVSVTLDEHTERRLTLGINVVDYAQKGGADMLVIGGYGHSPLYDSVVGGMTDDVLANATIPVFLSH